MRILFCADTFPGRFGPLASAFAAEGHDVLFASHYGRREFSLPGVRRVLLKPARRRSLPRNGEEAAHQEWHRALVTEHHAAETFASLRKNGFVPEMCVFASTSGAALALSRSWPESVLIGCAETARARASLEESRAVELRLRACLAQAHACFAFSEDRLAELPPLLRPGACLLPPAVDTEFFSPQAASPFELGGIKFDASHSCGVPGGAELVTVDLRSLPAASSSALWNICAGLLARRPECRLLLTCADGAIFEKAELMAEALPAEWRSRLFLREFASLHEWRDMLAATHLHIFTEPLKGGPLPELLEAMSCGAPVALPERSATALEAFFAERGESLRRKGAGPEKPLGGADFVISLPIGKVSERFSRIISFLEQKNAREVLKDKARYHIVKTSSLLLTVPDQLASVIDLYQKWNNAQQTIS